MSEPAADKLMRGRCRLMTREPWYGHMAMSIEWKASDMGWVKDEARRTIGFRINSQGVVQAFYYPEWVQKTDLRIIYGTIEHAINHLIRLHTLRTGGRVEDAWNLATDGSVNGMKANPLIGYREEDGALVLPAPDMFFVPRDWPENESAEQYYERIIQSQPNQQQGNQGQGQGKGQGKPGQGQGKGKGQPGQGQGQGSGGQTDIEQEGEESEDGQGQQDKNKKPGKPGYYQHGQHEGHALDDHESWTQSEISQDEARQVIHDMAHDATEKSQGFMPGHLKEILDQLAKPIVRWREILRQYLGTHVGNRRKTFSRVNRHQQQFGTKGISRHAAATVVVIVDTSGSIGTAELEQFFAEIELISYKAKCMILQWDAEYQGYERYRRGDWKRITCNGRGGTDMPGAYRWLEENKQIPDLTICLTDGFTALPEPRAYPMVWVSTTDQPGPEWGTTIYMTKYNDLK